MRLHCIVGICFTVLVPVVAVVAARQQNFELWPARHKLILGERKKEIKQGHADENFFILCPVMLRQLGQIYNIP